MFVERYCLGGGTSAVNHDQELLLLVVEKTSVSQRRHHAHIRPVLEATTQPRWSHTGDKQASGKNTCIFTELAFWPMSAMLFLM